MEAEARKELKRTSNRTIGRLIVYIVVINVLILLYTLGVQAFYMAKNADITMEQLYEVLNNHLSNSGLPMVLCVGLGFLVLWALMRRKVKFQTLFTKTEKKMTAKSFLMILCVFLSGQFIFSIMSAGMEAVANVFGYSLMGQIESATIVAGTVSMFFYVSFFAPVFEELIFRGFILRGMQPLGRKAAVIIAAFGFGLYHMNLPQALFAIYLGIVLGYVTTQYSIWWAIALHMINNLYAEVTGLLAQIKGLGFIESLSSYLFVIAFIMGIIIVIKKRGEIKAYFQTDQIEKGHLRCAFTSWTMILLIILCVGMTIPMITKL